MAKVGRKNLLILAVAGIALVGVAAYLYFDRYRFGSFCQAVEGGASLEELTEFWQRHDPKMLVEAPVGMIEHTTTRPYGCTYEVADGKVISARSL